MAHRAKSSEPSQRMLRVGELIRHELSAFLMRDEVADEDLYGVTITVPEVRVSPDLRLATAYVMPLGGAHADQIAKALNRHRKFIRGQIVPGLELKYAPQLRFVVDETFEEAGRIDELLKSDKVAQDLKHDHDLDDEEW